MNVLWAICLLLSACGSKQTTAPSAANPEYSGGTARTGMVYLLNETPYSVEVAYLYAEGDRGIRLVRSVVDSGTRRAISDEQLPANFRVDLDIVLQVPSSVGPRVRRKAPVQIQGDVNLRAYLVETRDPFSLSIESVAE